jgi:hypothetical protein
MAHEFAAKRKWSNDQHYRKHPKELFENIFYVKERRKPLPDDFAELAMTASLSAWRSSESFARLTDTLASWFPLETFTRRQ